MRVAVTGGAGRLGRALISRLANDVEPIILDVTEQKDAVEAGSEFRVADITDFDATAQALVGVDAVVHLAAIPWDLPGDAPLVGRVNMQGTLNVLEACARNEIGRVVIASSISAVGMMFRTQPWKPSFFPVDESHPATPDHVYGLTKLVNELEGEMYSRRHGMTVICFRIAPVWFEEMNPFTQLCVAGAFSPDINVDKIWAYVAASDVVDAARLALQADVPLFTVINVGAAEICSAEKTSLELIQTYYSQAKVTDPDLFAKDPFAPLWSINEARRLLGFSPRLSWRDFAPLLKPSVREAAEAGNIKAVRQEIYGHPGGHRLG